MKAETAVVLLVACRCHCYTTLQPASDSTTLVYTLAIYITIIAVYFFFQTQPANKTTKNRVMRVNK